MISDKLFNPESIVVVGGSNDCSKPGGKVIFNIIEHGYKGQLLAVNPRETIVQGKPCYPSCHELPQVDLAIIAVTFKFVEETISVLAFEKNCKAIMLN